MHAVSIQTLLWILLGLIVLSGFFSGSETGLMSLNRYRVRHLARQGNKTAKLINQLLERPDRLLGIILIGNTYTNIQAAAIAAVIGVRVLGEGGVSIATLGLTFIILIFAEVMPKTMAANYPFRFAFVTVWPLWVLLKTLYFIVWMVNAISNNLLKLFGVHVTKRGLEHLSGEELSTIVNEAGDKIPVDHQNMMLRILALEQVTVDDVMIPRQEIIGIDLDNDWESILKQLTESDYTRIPVYRDNIDKLRGILHVRDALNLLAENKLTKETLIHAASEPFFVPEGAPVTTQLLAMRQDKQRAAFIVDEYGDIQGLVTLDDILEEIVGEFTTDVADENKTYQMEFDGGYILEGNENIRELNRELEWNLPTDGPKTLSGLIIEHLETLPASPVCVKIAGYPIEVLTIKDNLIKRAKVYPLAVTKQVEKE